MTKEQAYPLSDMSALVLFFISVSAEKILKLCQRPCKHFCFSFSSIPSRISMTIFSWNIL